jgi:hypothetical protein
MPATYLLVRLESYIWYRAVTKLSREQSQLPTTPAVRPSLLPLEGLKLGESDIFPQLSQCLASRCSLRMFGCTRRLAAVAF